MTTATTVYRGYQSPRAWSRIAIEHDPAGTSDDQFVQNVSMSRNERVRPTAKPATSFVQFVINLDFDAVSQLTSIASRVEPEVELSLFVPTRPKSIRRVKFHVKRRVTWSPIPILPDSSE